MEDSFNFVAVLVSIIIGLGVTRVLSQLSEAIQAQDRQRNYWVHTLWMVNLFIYLMLAWWVFYRWRGRPNGISFSSCGSPSRRPNFTSLPACSAL